MTELDARDCETPELANLRNDMKKYCGLLFCVLLVSCASSSTGVMPTGNDTFSVSAATGGASGFGYSAETQKIVYEQADAFCRSKGKSFEVVSYDQTPYSFGRAATATLQFRCK